MRCLTKSSQVLRPVIQNETTHTDSCRFVKIRGYACAGLRALTTLGRPAMSR
jgi:hypothetical protein